MIQRLILISSFLVVSRNASAQSWEHLIDVARACTSRYSSQQFVPTDVDEMQRFGLSLNALASTVQIDGDCSASWVSKDGYLLTAAHCLGSCEAPGLTFRSDRPVRVGSGKCSVNVAGYGRLPIEFAVIGNCSKPALSMKACSKKNDIAILKLAMGNKRISNCLKLDSSPAAPGAKVAAVGYPAVTPWHHRGETFDARRRLKTSFPQVASFGEVTRATECVRQKKGAPLLAERLQIDPHYRSWGAIQATASISGGNSGGPLVDLTNGHVIGIASYSDESLSGDDQLCPGSSFFESLTKIDATTKGLMSPAELNALHSCNTR